MANPRTFMIFVIGCCWPSLMAGPALCDYQQDLERYNQAQQIYEQEAQTYWRQIAEKRTIRRAKQARREELTVDDYVLTQPPEYTGPSKPLQPGVPPLPPPVPKYIPVVADFLRSAQDEFGFTPDRPKNEREFKRAYAEAAHEFGLTKDQIVRIYAFEVGGTGTYDSQAGLEHPRPGARAITTALGYNQLLNTNTVEVLSEHGDEIIRTVESTAKDASGARRSNLLKKIVVLRQMVELARSVPDSWTEHERLANTPKGLGVHALNLDIDIGPLLQVQNLVTSVQFAKRKGYTSALSAAELETMNLTGDANGLDVVLMPFSLRSKVPTANLFQSAGYRANSIARRTKVIDRLLDAMNATMDQEAGLAGARELSSLYPN